MSEHEREMIERLGEDMTRLENDLEQFQLEHSVLEADLMLLREQEMPELLEKNEDLKDKCESLTCQFDNAYDEIHALTYPAPTPASSLDLESNDGTEDADLQVAEIEELRSDCDDSQQRITMLEKQVCVLAEKLEQTCNQVNRVSQDTQRSHVHEVTVAPTTAESVHSQSYKQSELDSGSTGLATPTASSEFKNAFNSGLGSLESLHSDTLVTPLTPQPMPQLVFPRYYTGDTLVCPGVETRTGKAATKAATATKATAAKAAKAIKRQQERP
ncbi:hypothetical protein IWW48_002678 [Coemansia sp. RSA 1200]|nr:hypothetical protein IWW48_002678 [Coemansia sp. RSA 1200]